MNFPTVFRNLAVLLVTVTPAFGAATTAVPDNLVVEGIPSPSPELRRDVSRFLEFRTAALQSWHPVRREMLITTRFADSMQLHLVREPGGARRQLTFSPEPVGNAQFLPGPGESLIYSQDTGGGEFFQLYRYDLADGRSTLLTDGKSRNTAPHLTQSGRQLVWSSTRRNGKEVDLWLMDPRKPDSARLLYQGEGGGWGVSDWSKDETKLLVGNYRSINDSALFTLDVATRKLDAITTPAAKAGEKVAYADARFSPDGKSVYCTSDQDREHMHLLRIDLTTKTQYWLKPDARWEAEFFELSPDGKTLAAVFNEDGVSVLRLLDAHSGKVRSEPKLPRGVIGGLEWHRNGRDLGFTLAHANAPSDAYSFDVKAEILTRWTESETGGLDATRFRTPELIRVKSFDDLSLSGFLYRPDAKKFPGKRPVLVSIHGGPESQSRPIFQGRNNYYLEELGFAILFPNVRGSAGYGKSFLTLDNGKKREDSVKDIGAFLDFIGRDGKLDARRVAVTGGSYGGYMTLASLVHFGERFRCGVDVVGISNFVTFLENTQNYRRDLRRAEYGDERDPEMRAVLTRISPLTQAEKIRVPLMVVQGQNDPRVPVTEAEQMVRAARAQGGVCWYLLAKDEGHGFAKKKNADFQFLSTILFFQEHLQEPMLK